jgi:GTPase SAR1 family protein
MKARENPFRSECVEAVGYRFVDGGSWHGLMGRLGELEYRAAIVGPDGSGKSTLLDELAPRLVDQGFSVKRLFLNDESPRPALAALSDEASDDEASDSEVSDKGIVLFDGADLLGRLEWGRFKRATKRAAGLIITSHRPGLLPTVIECRTTPEVFEEIVAELLNGRQECLPHKNLYEKHNGNVRDMLRELYDIYAAMA